MIATIVDTKALWETVVAAFVAGVGTTIIFSFAILGATKFAEAPLAYLLSALAALVYIVAAVALARRGRRAYWISVAAVGVELAGVLAVGLLSLLDPAALPHDTVWSGFGKGYGYVPLLLPVLGLWWLWRRRPAGPRAGSAA